MKARPIFSGTGAGEALRVWWPLHDHADRTTMSGFSPHEADALLLAALLSPEKLAERLLQCAVDAGITASERDQRLAALRAEEVSFATARKPRSARRTKTSSAPGQRGRYCRSRSCIRWRRRHRFQFQREAYR